MVKPSLTFTDETMNEDLEKGCGAESQENSEEQKNSVEPKKAKGALEVFKSTLSTPVRQRYAVRLEEGFDLEGQSPCFDVYKKLHSKAHPLKRSLENESKGNTLELTLLADAAALQSKTPDGHTAQEMSDNDNLEISPVLNESLVYPKAAKSLKKTRRSILDSCPNHLTSSESTREFSLKQLETVRSFAAKEKKAKL
jgi:hypothetical protein